MPTRTLEEVVDTHLAAYCEPDGARRLAAIRSVWSPQGRLVDPPFEARGHENISDQAATLLAQFEGHRFERSTVVDAHHDVLRYGWRLVDSTGKAAVEGVDILDLDTDGKIARVVGFFGAQPPAVGESAG